ncbi:MAG: primosomal protein N' [Clostridiales bacterium]|nr:primosomal protein N' [Clostridiales bacterium]
MFAQVILSISHMDIDHVFDYAVGSDLEYKVKIGMRVRVPFGIRGEEREGYVVKVMDKSDVPADKIKYIVSVPDDFPMFSENMLSLALWMRQRYFATLSKCLQTIMPSGIKDKTDYYVNVKYVRPTDKTKGFIEACDGDKRKQKQVDVLRTVVRYKEMPLAELKKRIGGAEYAVKTLRNSGYIEVYTKRVLADTQVTMLEDVSALVELNDGQKRVIAKWEMERAEKNRPFLIHGITGSGKTEIYIKMIEKVIAEGKQAIVLVPEISLTPLMTGRFLRRFGNIAAVSHSKMTYRERFNCWKRAKDGEVSVVIGPRSALFMPFDNLGIVIIDEEHEKGYVSENAPAYDAVETAEKLCEISGASLVLGSATPSVKSIYRASIGEIKYVRLDKRAKEGSIEPDIDVVDMREELKDGNRSVFSKALRDAIEERLKNKQQIMLFINRRGYSTFVSCRYCGYVIKCGHCDVSYKYHASTGKLTCHYCGDTIDRPKTCPVCGSDKIRYFGSGTQKAEDEIKKLFPEARVLRMDADSVKGKNGSAEILRKFGNGEADILIGTQMIAKGHDFENVTLVGILAADLSLNTGEYDSGERTYQLITQMAGRAGRGKLRGRVIVQTYEPDNEAIQSAVKGDTRGFYKREIEYRQRMGYPPCTECSKIEIVGMDEKNVIDCAKETADCLTTIGMTVLGPVPQAISKIKDEYRWMVTVKGDNTNRMREAVAKVYDEKRQGFENRGVYINPKTM